MVHLYKGRLLNNKQKWTTDTRNNKDEFQKHYAKLKNIQMQKAFLLEDSQKKAILMRTEIVSVVTTVWKSEGGMTT